MSQKKWAHDIGVQIDDCRYMYPSSELQSFQFKLSHRITATNSFLFKKQNYAPSVQKLKRVYCICFGNASTVKKD